MRSRNIKPGFFVNDQLAECSFAARLLFEGLWCLADREGRLEDRPIRIKGSVFPYDSVDIEELLEELSTQGLIVRYIVNAKKYIAIPTFSKHQKPHVKEAQSVIPPYIEGESDLGNSEPLPRSVPAPTQVVPSTDLGDGEHALIPDVLIPDILIPDSQNTEPSTEEPSAPSVACDSNNKPAKAESFSKDFETFFDAYPRQIEKMAAWRNWKRLLKVGTDPKTLIRTAENYAEKCRREQTQTRYMKKPGNFLGRDEMWRDYIGAHPPEETGSMSLRSADGSFGELSDEEIAEQNALYEKYKARGDF